MKAQLLISVLFLTITILCGCEEERICLIGSGDVHTYEIHAGPINSVTIYGPVNLRYTQEATPYVTVEAESEMFRHLSYHVADNELIIGYRENVSCFETRYGVWINVNSPELRKITAEGVNEIISKGPIDQTNIKVITQGTANVKLSGRVGEQILSGSGLLNVQNFNLQSVKTVVDFDGTANVEVSCSDLLDIDIQGSATIFYKGNPSINNKGNGSISLHAAN